MKNSHSSSVVRWIVLAVALSVVVGVYFSMGRGYGKVSDRSYKYATALYSVCLSKSGERLEKVSALIEKDTVDELIPSHEHGWLASIVGRAQDGDWESAAKSSKRMMEDQVEY